MRILFVVHQFMPEFAAGTERVTYALARSAQRDGHEVQVLTCSTRDVRLWSDAADNGLRSASIGGIPVTALLGSAMDNFAQLGFVRGERSGASLDEFLDSRGPFDLIHVTHSLRMVEALEAAHARSIPSVITLTDFFLLCYRINLVRPSGELCSGPADARNCQSYCPVPELDAASLRERYDRLRGLLFAATVVVACSDFVADAFRSEFPGLRIKVVEHGIDLWRFGPPPARERTGPMTFGFLGTMDKVKGVHVLAEAFALAAPANARLELVGPCFDERYMQRLEACADKNSFIAIRPAVSEDETVAVLNGFDVLCLPSLVPETFSLTLHEGFAAGLHCLVSDLGHPGRVVREAGCGDVVPAGDVSAWAECISRLALSPSLVARSRRNLPLPRRTEEEGFIYSRLYRQAARRSR